ncbi:MAG: LysR family transcriptional regulator [Gammaproteobacteria bacterium]|nr:LysR family transcriptional regulator [Gammaproteobacteria bacterium]
MDLNQLQIFAKIAEYQSFTKAAAELQMDKSTVSNKLSQLESRLGVRLLNRSTRSVTLTEAGEGYYRYCLQIMETAQEAEQFTATLGNEAVGLLRVSASNSFAGIFIHELIQPFMKENPKVEVELILGYENVDLVKERIDIALRADIGAGALKDSSLIARKVMNSEIGLFCSPSFTEEHGELKDMGHVNDFDFIEFTSGPAFNLSGTQGERVHRADLKGRFKVNDVLRCKEAAVAGLGIAVLPKFITRDEVKNKQLMPLLADYQFPAINLYAVYPSRQWMPAKLKVFLEHLNRWGQNRNQKGQT